MDDPLSPVNTFDQPAQPKRFQAIKHNNSSSVEVAVYTPNRNGAQFIFIDLARWIEKIFVVLTSTSCLALLSTAKHLQDGCHIINTCVTRSLSTSEREEAAKRKGIPLEEVTELGLMLACLMNEFLFSTIDEPLIWTLFWWESMVLCYRMAALACASNFLHLMCRSGITMAISALIGVYFIFNIFDGMER